jgi:hypothetical protein
MKRTMVAAAMVALLSSPAGAEVTGNDLHQYCRRHNQDFCRGFIIGAVDMFIFQMVNQDPICVRDGMTWDQLPDVVVNHITAHPETRHEPAIYLVVRAIREVFDCPIAEKEQPR